MSTNEINSDETTSNETDERHLATTPYYTIIILTAIVVVFLFQQLLDINSVVHTLALNKDVMATGEAWQLLTSMVVHDGITHIAFNGYALFVLGRIVETISNRANVSLVFLLSGIGGGCLSFLFLPIPSLGASGGVIGLVGYLTVYGYRRRQIISDSLLKNMLLNIGLIAVVGVFIFPGIDNWGHLGGLLTGIVYGLFQIPDDLHVDPRIAGRSLDLVGKSALGIVLLTCVATITLILIWYFQTGDLFPHFLA